MGDNKEKKPLTVYDEYAQRLEAIFSEHNPAKVKSIPELLKKYKNKEHTIYKKVCGKYKVREKAQYKEPKKKSPQKRKAGKKKVSKEDKLKAEVNELKLQREQLERTIDSLSDEQLESGGSSGNFDKEREKLLQSFESEREQWQERARDEYAAYSAELEAELLESFIEEKEELIQE